MKKQEKNKSISNLHKNCPDPQNFVRNLQNFVRILRILSGSFRILSGSSEFCPDPSEFYPEPSEFCPDTSEFCSDPSEFCPDTSEFWNRHICNDYNVQRIPRSNWPISTIKVSMMLKEKEKIFHGKMEENLIKQNEIKKKNL